MPTEPPESLVRSRSGPPWRRVRSWAALLLVLSPVLVGAVVAWGDEVSVAQSAPRQVAVVTVSGGTVPAAITATAGPQPAPVPVRFGDALAATQDFEWTERTVDQARTELSNGTLLAAVLVPPALGSTAHGNESENRITIVAGRGDATTYADLSRVVTATAARIGVDDVVVPLSRARIDLNVAFLTANGIKGAVAQAESTFTEALASVDSLITQSDPLVANAQLLLDGIQQNTAVLDDLTDTLSRLSSSVVAVDVTVGDLRRGAVTASEQIQVAVGAINETAVIRRQISDVAQSVLAQWPTTGIAEFDRLADQLSVVVDLAGGGNDATILSQLDGGRAAADILGGQIDQLSILLGQPVGDQTRLSDLLLITVDRLRSVRELLAMGNDTVHQVIEQLNGAKTQLPQTKQDIRSQLDKFNVVSAQLVQSLDKGIDGLPSTSSSAPILADSVDVVSMASPQSTVAVGATSVGVFLLLAGLVVAYLVGAPDGHRSPPRQVRSGPLVACAVVLGAAVAGVVGWLVLAPGAHSAAVATTTVLGAFSLTLFAVAAIWLLDRAGVVVVLVLVAGSVLVLARGEGASARWLIPDQWVSQAISNAGTQGPGVMTTPAAAVLVCLALTSALCLAASARRLRRA